VRATKAVVTGTALTGPTASSDGSGVLVTGDDPGNRKGKRGCLGSRADNCPPSATPAGGTKPRGRGPSPLTLQLRGCATEQKPEGPTRTYPRGNGAGADPPADQCLIHLLLGRAVEEPAFTSTSRTSFRAGRPGPLAAYHWSLRALWWIAGPRGRSVGLFHLPKHAGRAKAKPAHPTARNAQGAYTGPRI